MPHSKGLSSRLHTDDGWEFKGVCHAYLEDAKPKNEKGSITNINHVVFAPSTGTKRRLGVVERFNRTFRKKYVKFAKMMKAMKKTAYDAIHHILNVYNFIDDHKSIEELITGYEPKGKRSLLHI